MIIPGEHLAVGWVNFPNPENYGPASLRVAQTVCVRDSRVVYSTAMFRPYKNLNVPSTEVLMPATGVCMGKEKGKLRELVPGELMAVMRIWMQALSGGFSAVLGDGCSCCEDLDPEMEIHCCPLCQCSFHNKCCHALLNVALDTSTFAAPEKPLGWPRPFGVPGTLCNLCAHFYG